MYGNRDIVHHHGEKVMVLFIKLFNELGPRYAERPGGYIRILKCGFRAGDNAPMAYVELVDRPIADEAAAEE